MTDPEKINPVKAGIAGCGGITPTVLRSIESFEEIEVVAVQDVNPAALISISNEFDISRTHTDYKALLDEDVELIIINTPNHLHLPMAVEAFKAGKHCFVQKPLARNVEEGEVMIRASEKAGKLLGVVMLERADPVYRQIRSMVQDGCFGTITLVRSILAHTNHLTKPPPDDNWRSSPEKIGGGSFIQLGVHHMDIIRFILDDEITEVTALSSSCISPDRFPVDESSGVVVKFKSGAIGQFLTGFAATADSVEFNGTAGMISRDEEKLEWLTCKIFEGEIWDAPRVDERHVMTMPNTAENVFMCRQDYEPHRMFARAIRGLVEVETPGEIGLDALRVVEAVRKSAEEGISIRID